MQKLKKGIRRIEAMVLALLLLVNTIDMSVFASKSQMISCENHGEHTAECGYVEGEDGSACNHECSVESGCLTAEVSENSVTEESQDGEMKNCICAEKCKVDAVNTECEVCSLEGADFTLCVGEENNEKTVVCDCETDDPSYHATNCQAYVAPEHAEFFVQKSVQMIT